MQWVAIARAPMNEMLAWAVCDSAGERCGTFYDRSAGCLSISLPVTAASAAWAAMSAEVELKTLGVAVVKDLHVMTTTEFGAESLAERAT